MKITDHKRKWALNKVSGYSKLLGIEQPKVFFTKVEYNRWKEEKRTQKGQKVGRTNVYGACHKKDGLIVVLIKSAPSLAHLDDTIRHELIHYTKSYNHCSKNFERCMISLKKGKVKNGRF